MPTFTILGVGSCSLFMIVTFQDKPNAAAATPNKKAEVSDTASAIVVSAVVNEDQGIDMTLVL